MTTENISTYDDTTALLVVDVQNDFADPEGGLYVDGGEQVVPPINDQIEAARDAGALIVYTQDWHPPETPHFEKDGGTWPVHCVRDTWGAEFHPDLDVIDAPIVKKGVDGGDGYSGFSVRDPVSGDEEATELGSILEDAGISEVVVTGLAGDVCVKETALDAARLGYDVTVPAALTRFVELEEGDADRALDELRDAGVRVVS